MSMFTRPDKPDTADSAAQSPEARRPQAAAQPLSSAPQPAKPAPGAGQTAGVSVISKALKITGQLESTEDIQIDGEIDGDVRGVSVKVGSNARVKGTVYGDAVELAGTVDGKIEAKKVVLASTAHMSGDVVHQDITIQSGAFIDGHCKPEYGKSETRSSAGKSPAASEKPNGNGAAART